MYISSNGVIVVREVREVRGTVQWVGEVYISSNGVILVREVREVRGTVQ